MIARFISLFILILLASLTSFGQKEANFWYFGDYIGFDFNNNNPTPLSNSNMESVGATAVRSDQNTGKLLFYSNGESVWNEKNQVMPNGSHLLGETRATQSALIVPIPEEPNLFYLFTVSKSLVSPAKASRIYYSIIDMSLDNGFGDIPEGKKNIPIIDNVAEKLTAIPVSDGIGYWLITHGVNNNSFFVFKISGYSISDPKTFNIGSIYELNTEKNEAVGFLKASPNGKLLASTVTSGTYFRAFELFDFNHENGEISNPLSLGDFSLQYGLSFSPDNTKLYLKATNNSIDARDILHQFDLNSEDIKSTRVGLIRTNPNFDINQYNIGLTALALQIAPDGNIYGAGNPSDFENQEDQNAMLVIEKPNAKGIAAQIMLKRFNFRDGAVTNGLPNFIENIFNGISASDNPNVLCTELELYQLFPNPTTATINITVSERCFTPYFLTIYNLLGQSILTLWVNSQISDEVDISQLSTGTYYAVLNFSDKRIVKRLVKL